MSVVHVANVVSVADERRILELQELAHAMLSVANVRWSNTITANFWPYANDTTRAKQSTKLRECKIPIGEVPSNYFRILRWRLTQTLEAIWMSDLCDQSRSFQKWLHRLEAGIYFEKLPKHGRNIACVMDRDTALMSPQFQKGMMIHSTLSKE